MKAVILFSGGLDSTTALAIALAEGYELFPLTIDYGQRHRAEILAAKQLVSHYQLSLHRIVSLNIQQFGGSALTDQAIDVPDYSATSGIKSTYVPARNTIFLSIALSYAETLGANCIIMGSCQADAACFPDDSPEYFHAFQQLAALATKAGRDGQTLELYNPLLTLSKADAIKRGIALNVDYQLTHSCYNPDSTGVACGCCDACGLRLQGFQALGMTDPIKYQ